MKGKTRREELIEKIEKQLRFVEFRIIAPPGELTDAEFAKFQQEAIHLREVLKMLNSL